MSSAMSGDNTKSYEKLTRQFPLRLIRDEDHNECAAVICDEPLERSKFLNSAERRQCPLAS